MDKLKSNEPSDRKPDLWDSWVDTTLGLHQTMEEEINQTILYSNKYMNVYMFDNLKAWLNDYRILGVNKNLITQEIDKYNERKYSDLLKR
jgi:hypothetical protein